MSSNTLKLIKPGLNKRFVLSTLQKKLLRVGVGSFCLGSELIHLWLLPEQYIIFIGYGIVFLLIAMAQGFTGALIFFGPRRRILTFGLWCNILIVLVYGFTHTFGVIVGTALMLLPVDIWGLVATLLEIGIIIGLYALRRDSKKPKLDKSKRKRPHLF